MLKTKLILTITFLIGVLALVGLITSPTTKQFAHGKIKFLGPSEQANPSIVPSPSKPSNPPDSFSDQTYLVTKVVDGDTVELESGQKVRYIGMDTPETVDPRKSVQCFGKEASNKNAELVGGKEVRLEKDISETDSFGRLLRYVFVGEDTFVNLVLVKEGYAKSSTYPPDVKYQELFRQAEVEAREKGAGLWSAC